MSEGAFGAARAVLQPRNCAQPVNRSAKAGGAGVKLFD